MKRREFIRLCAAGAAAGINPAFPAASMKARHYSRVQSDLTALLSATPQSARTSYPIRRASTVFSELKHYCRQQVQC